MGQWDRGTKYEGFQAHEKMKENMVGSCGTGDCWGEKETGTVERIVRVAGGRLLGKEDGVGSTPPRGEVRATEEAFIFIFPVRMCA